MKILLDISRKSLLEKINKELKWLKNVEYIDEFTANQTIGYHIKLFEEIIELLQNENIKLNNIINKINEVENTSTSKINLIKNKLKSKNNFKLNIYNIEDNKLYIKTDSYEKTYKLIKEVLKEYNFEIFVTGYDNGYLVEVIL